MNKQVLALIVLLVALLGITFLYDRENPDEVAYVPVETPVEAIPSTPVKKVSEENGLVSISFSAGPGVHFLLPSGWEYNSSRDYGNGLQMVVAGLNTSKRTAQKYSDFEDANVELYRYPVVADEEKLGCFRGCLLEKELTENLNFLSEVYREKSLPADADTRNLKAGFFWPTGVFQKRIEGMRYVQNNSGTLRGVSFFANETQELGFRPVYKTVLYHPKDNFIVVLNVEIGNFKELDFPHRYLITQNYELWAQENIENGSVYLSNFENLKNTELGTFLLEIDEINSSLEIL